MEPLKVIRILLMVLTAFAATTTASHTKNLVESTSLPSATSLAHCPQTCGDIANIPDIFPGLSEDGSIYPFGFGSGCSRPGFELICNNSIYPPKVCLGDGTTEITYGEFEENNLEVKLKIHIMDSKVNIYNGSWNPGQPFTVYADNYTNSSFVVIGCGVDAYLLDENNTEIGNCSTTCESDNQIRRQEGECNGIGCCSIPIDHRPSPIHFKITRNKKKSKLSLQNVKAFMYTYHNDNNVVDNVGGFVVDDFDVGSQYILSQEDLDSIDTVGGMNFFTMLVEWSIPSQLTCEKAKGDNTTYACISDNSECTRNGNGYTCLCPQNYEGNAYILDGCARQESLADPVNAYNSRPGPNCTRHCGNIDVPFPFGLSTECSGKESFRLQCRKEQLLLSLQGRGDLDANDHQVTEILVNEGLLQVKTSQNYSFTANGENNAYTSNGQWDLSWVIDNITCQAAKQNKKYNYACVSKNSECLNISSTYWGDLGYRCRCNAGYQGNPYLADEHGCQDVDECRQMPHICNDKKCINTPGSYKCEAARRGRGMLLLDIIIGISSGIGVVLITVGIIRARSMWRKEEIKRMRKKHFNKNQGILLHHLISSDESISQKTKNFSLEELEIATNNFDGARISGQGGHGTVYKGILLDQRVVAIKRAKLVNASEINQFINEVVLLSQIVHRNVVKLFGCCLETEVPLLVYEFISNGTLYNKLHESPDGTSSLTWGDRLRIAAEAAGALAYLHSAASISIFHRDLKSTNILLDDNYTAKLSDFGASRCVPIDQKQVVTVVQGTFGYLDPEYYHTGQLSDKSDVYSFGVIIVELLTRKKPIFTNSLGEPVNLSNCFLQALRDGSHVTLLDDEVLEDATQEELTAMINLVEMCLKMRGEERPTMKDVEMRLQAIQSSRTRQGQSAQTNEEGTQPEVAELVDSYSLYTASW